MAAAVEMTTGDVEKTAAQRHYELAPKGSDAVAPPVPPMSQCAA